MIYAECLKTTSKTTSLFSHQHAQPSFSLSKWMSIGSEKSPLYSSDSSCANAFLAITVGDSSKHYSPISVMNGISIPSKACSTFTASFALVSKYGIPPFDWQNVIALLEETILLFSSTSILLPSTTLKVLLALLVALHEGCPHKREILRISRARLY